MIVRPLTCPHCGTRLGLIGKPDRVACPVCMGRHMNQGPNPQRKYVLRVRYPEPFSK
jgi:DNA-directed RNA polymerase subunit RPC12/RpoP